MRSHIRKQTKKLIGYMLSQGNSSALEKLCSERKILLRTIGRESAESKVSELLLSDIDNRGEDVTDAPEEQCLIIDGFTSSELDRLLELMRNAKIKIDLKCVVTQHNRNMRLSELIEELKKEHTAMHG